MTLAFVQGMTTTCSAWALTLAMMLIGCGAASPDAAEGESDPPNIEASTASQKQLGVSRWDIHDAPNTIAGYDAEDNLAVLLQYQRVEHGTTVLHNFGLRNHANQAVTQLALPKDATSTDALEVLAHQVSAGFDPTGALTRMLSDFEHHTVSALSTSTLGAGSLRPLGDGAAGAPAPPQGCTTEEALVLGCSPKLVATPKQKTHITAAADQTRLARQYL